MTSQRTRARMVERLREQGIRDERVLAAMGSVPRHLFVEEALASRAYEDTALPIGFGQTISQPYVVARMIEVLLEKAQPGKLLEVGTGCGYQAAVLAQLFPEVYSIERIKGLHERARANLLGLRLKNLRLAHGDGYAGLEKAAPVRFDHPRRSAARSAARRCSPARARWPHGIAARIQGRAAPRADRAQRPRLPRVGARCGALRADDGG